MSRPSTVNLAASSHQGGDEDDVAAPAPARYASAPAHAVTASQAHGPAPRPDDVVVFAMTLSQERLLAALRRFSASRPDAAADLLLALRGEAAGAVASRPPAAQPPGARAAAPAPAPAPVATAPQPRPAASAQHPQSQQQRPPAPAQHPPGPARAPAPAPQAPQQQRAAPPAAPPVWPAAAPGASPKATSVDELVATAHLPRAEAEALVAIAALRPPDGLPMRDLTRRPAGFANPLVGYIFMCNDATFQECVDRWLLGMPAGGGNEVMLRRIAPEYTQLFLYNSDDKYLYGVFEARTPGGVNLVPEAWCVQPWRGLTATPPPPSGTRTRFGAQVNVAMGHFFATALRREHFVSLLRPQGHHFHRDLTATETLAVLNAFMRFNTTVRAA